MAESHMTSIFEAALSYSHIPDLGSVIKEHLMPLEFVGILIAMGSLKRRRCAAHVD